MEDNNFAKNFVENVSQAMRYGVIGKAIWNKIMLINTIIFIVAGIVYYFVIPFVAKSLTISEKDVNAVITMFRVSNIVILTFVFLSVLIHDVFRAFINRKNDNKLKNKWTPRESLTLYFSDLPKLNIKKDGRVEYSFYMAIYNSSPYKYKIEKISYTNIRADKLILKNIDWDDNIKILEPNGNTIGVNGKIDFVIASDDYKKLKDKSYCKNHIRFGFDINVTARIDDITYTPRETTMSKEMCYTTEIIEE